MNPPQIASATNETQIEKLYWFRLYVSGTTPQSTKAIANIKNVFDQLIKDQYELEVIDIYQQMQLSLEDEIITVPTLVKKKPLPCRHINGDLSNSAYVIAELNLNTLKEG